MGNTLRSYAIRQIALPTFMALLTTTFILMIQSMYQVINLLMLPDVTLLDVGKLLGLLLPSVLIFSTPMAVLIGCLIGVGRMTMDREILAIRASGVNLISVFMPTMAAGLILSGAIFGLTATWIPSTQYSAQLQANALRMALADALQPGRFYETKELFGSGAILYFGGRDSKTGELQKIVVEQEEDVKIAAADGESGTTATATQVPADATGLALRTGGAGAEDPNPAKLADKAARSDGTELTLTFAAAGRIESEQIPTGPDTPPDQGIVLSLRNGSIHRLSPDPTARDYVFMTYKTLTNRSFKQGEVEKRQKTIRSSALRRQLGELRADIAQQSGQLAKLNPDSAEEADRIADLKKGIVKTQRSLGVLLKEIWQRRAMWLASFIFILTGIPLAIWVRPSGKSWGILLAIALLLIYYVILQTGLTMIASARPGGILVAMAPNILYALLGAYLWRQTLRS